MKPSNRFMLTPTRPRTNAEFTHQHAGHCESGVASALLRHSGFDMSESMAFGLSSGLAFAYLPFVKLSGLPLIAYRTQPKSLIKGLRKPLGVDFSFETFSGPERGQARLDELLAQGHVVGLQTSVYWLPYFPPEMRFHFNAHNLLVYGKEGDEYLISDPVFEAPVRCKVEDLNRSRFAKGVLAPKGLLYVLNRPPRQAEVIPAVLGKAIAKTCRRHAGTGAHRGCEGHAAAGQQVRKALQWRSGHGRLCRPHGAHARRDRDRWGGVPFHLRGILARCGRSGGQQGVGASRPIG